MEKTISKYLNDSFAQLVEKRGLRKSKEFSDKQSFSADYVVSNFTIKIEKYWRQFYVTLFKTGNNEGGVNLFNLLSYLHQTSSDVPVSNYFEGDDLDDSYKKQLSYLASVVDSNFTAIEDFFKEGNYELKMAEVRNFMINKYPELFKRK